MGLRERKKAETRTALSWAAIRLTVERGLEAVKVEDIAEAAGVSPRTFNNYFSSKAEAIAARHLDRALMVAEHLRERPADEPLWTAVKAAVLAQLQPGPEVTEHPPADREFWVTGVRLMVADPAYHGEFLRASAVAQGELAKAVADRTGVGLDTGMYPHLVASAVMSASDVATRHWLRTDGRAGIDELLTSALDQLAAGLPTP